MLGQSLIGFYFWLDTFSSSHGYLFFFFFAQEIKYIKLSWFLLIALCNNIIDASAATRILVKNKLLESNSLKIIMYSR